MPPTHAVSPVTRAHRAIAMHTTAQLSIVSTPVAPSVPEERPSGIRFRTVRPIQARTQPTALRASQVDAVARREIHWYHTSKATDPASECARARIYCWLLALDGAERETLALRYDPLPCPASLAEHWGEGGFALALRLAFAGPWRPKGRPRRSAEPLATEQLAAAVKQRGAQVLDHIKRRAEWDFASALSAYARARGRVPSVLPVSR